MAFFYLYLSGIRMHVQAVFISFVPVTKEIKICTTLKSLVEYYGIFRKGLFKRFSRTKMQLKISARFAIKGKLIFLIQSTLLDKLSLDVSRQS